MTQYQHLKSIYPTPIMAGVRTPLRQFASCVLVDSDDTLDSIFSSDMAIGRYVAQRAGIGINAGRITRTWCKDYEVEKSNILESFHSLKSLKQQSEVVPKTESEVEVQQSISQSGIKKSNDIIVLKNNKGTEDNRVRKLDYSIQLSRTIL